MFSILHRGRVKFSRGVLFSKLCSPKQVMGGGGLRTRNVPALLPVLLVFE